MRSLAQFIDDTRLSSEAKDFVRLELYTGCGKCGRRLVGENNAGEVVLAGIVVYAVQDQAGNNVAAYALCEGCDHAR